MKRLIQKCALISNISSVITLVLALSHSQAFAFEDIYEDDGGDNSFEHATHIRTDDKERHQHTLHSRDDEDWFRVYLEVHGSEGGKNPYDILLYSGVDIDVAFELYKSDGSSLINEVNKRFTGGDEFILDWTPPSDGYYYIKVSDTELEQANCRKDIQYELRVSNPNAPLYWALEGVVTDVISGKPINGATVNMNENNCNSNPVETEEDGKYLLNYSCVKGTYEITASTPGYKTLTCHIPTSENSKITKNLPLYPDDQSAPIEAISYRNSEDRLLPSQGVYQNGDTLKVDFPVFFLPPDICVLYYLAMGYPNGDLRIITGKNEFVELGASVPHWKGEKEVVIEMPVDDMPRGKYQLYLLRMPATIDDPIAHLDKGELNMSNFEVK
jgi:hypothetical protein